MKSYKQIFRIAVRIIPFCFLLFFLSCDTALTPTEFEISSLTMEMTGGPANNFEKISVTNTYLAALESTYPVLYLQLSKNEYGEIKSYLLDYHKYKDLYTGGPSNDYHYKLTIKRKNLLKIIEFDRYSLDNNPDLDSLSRLVHIFYQLSLRIYLEEAEWWGLDYGFGCSYSRLQGDSIQFSYKIMNSDYRERSIYFRNQYRYQLKVTGDFQEPRIETWIPENSVISTDIVSPSKITLAPGEKYEFKGEWDQKFMNYDNVYYSQLPKGKYKVTIYLLGGQEPGGRYPFSMEFPLYIE